MGCRSTSWAQDEEVRAGADFVLARLDGITATDASSLDLSKPSGCRTVEPGGGAATFELAPGLNSVTLESRSGKALPAVLELGRFADEPSVPVGKLKPGTESIVGIPDDASDRPWTARSMARFGSAATCREASR